MASRMKKTGVCTGTFGMHNTFRDSFAIEMSKLFKKMDVLNECWASRASGHRILVISRFTYTYLGRAGISYSRF